MTSDILQFLEPLRRMQRRISERVVAACEQSQVNVLASIAQDGQGDTIYAIDRISEDTLVDFVAHELAVVETVVLIAEGLPGGQVVLPYGRQEHEARWRLIVDPIDGTRGLMYQKRSAWVLAGIAPNKGPNTGLADVELAVQTEIPLIKQHLFDALWAVRGKGAEAERINRLSGTTCPLALHPSKAHSIAHGFAMLARFFPGGRGDLAAIDDEIVAAAVGPVQFGKAACFEDQYISTGGQLYELMAGHDRFVADLRPLLEHRLHRQGQSLGLCCHPYDLCTELIARELGVVLTSPGGQALNARLSIEPDVAWVGYANPQIRDQIEPLLQSALRDRQMLA